MRYFSIGILSIALAVAGCGKNNKAECSDKSECGSDETCESGTCVAAEPAGCTADSDCDAGMCTDGECVAVEPTPDMGMETVDMPPAIDLPEIDMGPDIPPDEIPPEVVSFAPADEAVDVPLDVQVTITFSEPIDSRTVNSGSIELRDPSNTPIAATVSYDEEAMAATVAPTEPLRPATPYRAVVKEFVRDASQNSIAETTATFSTVFEEPTGIRAIAEKFAPVIYQATNDTTSGAPTFDIPTTVNFDNNLNASDNESKAKLGTTKTTASVYYSVIESDTHYFVTYVLYYPGREADERFEHDFTGSVVVVDKATEKLIVIEGVRTSQSSDTPLGFAPDDSTVTGNQLEKFPADSLEETHYPMFVPAGVHESCVFPIAGNPPYCLHNAGEMPGGTDGGVVMRWAEQGQKYDEAVENAETGFLELQYALVPMVSTLWAWRTLVGPDRLWEGTAAYAPMGETRPATTPDGSPLILPNRLASDAETSYGKSPFQWLRSPGETNYGQWLIDPTVMLTARYDFGPDWSTDYCYNPYLDINLRGDASHPECETDP